MDRTPLIAVLTNLEDYHKPVLEGICKEREVLQRRDAVTIEPFIIDDFVFTYTRDKMREMVDKQPAVVITIGVFAAQVAAHFFAAEKIGIPLIVCGVANFTDLNLEKVIGSAGTRIIGVGLGYPSYLTVARTLLWFKPETKSVLIPYDSQRVGGVLTSASRLIREFFTNNGIRVQIAQITEKKNVVDLVRAHLSEVDAVVTLEGCASDENASEIAALCNESKVTYFASSLEAMKKGAALGIISNPSIVGRIAFRRCVQILVDGFELPNGHITLFKNEGRQVGVNLNTCEAQGVQISEEKLYLLRNSMVAGNFYQMIDGED